MLPLIILIVPLNIVTVILVLVPHRLLGYVGIITKVGVLSPMVIHSPGFLIAIIAAFA